MNYTIEDLFQSINDIYEQLDTGKIDPANADKLAKKCCKAFLTYLDTHFEKKPNEL